MSNMTPMLPPPFLLDISALLRYSVGREGFPSLPLLDQSADQIDQRLDEVQDGGNQDDGLERFVLVAAFLYLRHFLHLPPDDAIILHACMYFNGHFLQTCMHEFVEYVHVHMNDTMVYYQ